MTTQDLFAYQATMAGASKDYIYTTKFVEDCDRRGIHVNLWEPDLW